MHHDEAIHVLNDLLAAERQSLIARLAEASPYVPWPAAEESLLLRRMIDDHKRHERELAEMILRIGGTPAYATYPSSAGDVHYLRLDYLMPRIIAAARELVRAYETCGGTGHPEADALIGRILTDHKRHLTQLARCEQPV